MLGPGASIAEEQPAALPASAEAVLAVEPELLVERIRTDRMVVLEETASAHSDSLIVAYLDFRKSRDEVLALLRQADRQTEYRPELTSVRTIRHFEGGRVDEQQLRVLFTKLVYRLRYVDEGERGRITWQLDPDFENDLSRVEGFWELYSYQADPGRTLARFGSNVDVGPMVPRSLQQSLSRRTVVRYLSHFLKWVDSGGTWRP